jgi:hypothetical protein
MSRIVFGRRRLGLPLGSALYLIAVANVLAQGTVNFRNSVLPTPPDRRFYHGDGMTPLAGTNYVAQLYYGSNVWTLQSHTTSPAPFSSSMPGTWLGGNRTLNGFPPGSLVTMAVKVWDSRYGSTPEEAARNGALCMGTHPFTYTVPPQGADPTNYYMYGFVPCYGFACCSCDRPPRLDRQPENQTVASGADVTLSVNALGACFGEWRFNGTNSLGPGRWVFGYSNFLTLTNVQSSHSGAYQLLLGSYAGFVTSEVALLTVVVPPRLTSVARAGSQFRFYVPGESGRYFAIETTTNLSSLPTWEPVHTNVAPFWFTNSTPDADRQRFYRAILR